MSGGRGGGLFETYPSAPAVIAATGDELTTRSTAIDAVREQVDHAARGASGAVDGLLVGPVQQAPQPVRQAHSDLAGAALVAAGAVRLWSRHVESFDTGVTALNLRWAIASATGFGVAAPDYSGADTAAERDEVRGDHADAVSGARATLLRELQVEHARLVETLDGQADTVAAHLDAGPTDDTVLALLRVGALPPTALTLFPDVRLSDGDLATMLAALQRHGGLDAWLAPQSGTTSQDLLRQLDAVRAMGLEPADYAELLRSYWSTVALEKAGIDPTLWDPSKGADELAPIIEAVYRYYGDLFLDNPSMQWAGMANMIGPSFAAGFSDLALMRQIADTVNGPVEDLPGPVQALLPPQLQGVNILSQLSEADIRFYETTFLSMQQEIFYDQATMHEAYLGGGMDAIQEMYDAGLLSGADGRADPDQALAAWQQIDDGRWSGDEDLVAAGNEGLLYREQAYIIDNEYQDMKSHLPTGPALTYLMGAIGAPSVPGARSLAEVDPLEVHIDPTPGGPFGIPNPVPSLKADVETPLPASNIADFEPRWELIQADTLPTYQQLLAEDPEYARALVGADVGERIDDYRLHNRIDDILGDLGTNWDVDISYGW